jgi:hypothetical protein
VFFVVVNNGYGWGVFCNGQQWVWVGCFFRRSTVGIYGWGVFLGGRQWVYMGGVFF